MSTGDPTKCLYNAGARHVRTVWQAHKHLKIEPFDVRLKNRHGTAKRTYVLKQVTVVSNARARHVNTVFDHFSAHMSGTGITARNLQDALGKHSD